MVAIFRIDNNAENLRAYLFQSGYLKEGEQHEITPLGGGVSNDVFKVMSDRGAVVFKQALPQLRVKDDWFVEPDRANIEKDYLKLIRDLLGPKYAPRVVWEDEENYLFAMEFAPPGSEMWKAQLLRGEVDFSVAEQVAQILAVMHNRTYENEAVVQHFDNQQRFIDLRVDPYFETIARRHPELEREIRAEINRILTLRKTLVHGDYSPKNILVTPGAEQIWLLDGEVAHIGDPTFDTGFLLNHLLLKAVHMPAVSERLFEAFLRMGRSYLETISVFAPDWIEENTCRELGLLLLARVDGKSPAEYLTEADRAIIRTASTRIIREQPVRFGDLVDVLQTEVQRARQTN
ncbi:MAG TPA: phosphotransferase [Firmicutes bacterium]|nr:phosphotransferase [Bacillota bacterium]